MGIENLKALFERGLPKKVPGTRDAYADKSGLIWYFRKGQWLDAKLQANTDGYLRFYYYSDNEDDKKRHRMFAHHGVWRAHRGDIPEGFDVDHEDFNHQNNALGNLRLLTVAKNRCRHGPIDRRDRMPLLQLENVEDGTIKTIQGIKYAAEFIGVSATTVNRAMNGKQKTAGGWRVFILSE